MRKTIFFLVVFVGLALVTSVYAQNDGSKGASATLKDVDGQIIGSAKFMEDATDIVHVNVHVKGISPGLHGIHIHAIGSCEPTFAAAGGHHNPLGHQHGLNNPDGSHAGDLPNLTVNEAGIGYLTTTTDRVTLSPGPITLFDANGSVLVIHANPDDQVTDPTGNSGDRIACGVIEGH